MNVHYTGVYKGVINVNQVADASYWLERFLYLLKKNTMKYTLLLFVLLMTWKTVVAHPPQKIYSITRQNLSTEYYFQQAALWKQELEQQNKNAVAWLNYFMAHQLLLEKGAIAPAQLKTVQQDLQAALPQSFEAYYAQYIVEKDLQALLQAYQLAPERPETYEHLANHYHLTFQEEKLQQICQQWLASGEYSNGLLHWNYNALVGLEKNALLLTEGDNYTQPLWLLQYGKGIRPDVQVLSLEAMQQPSYRKQVLEEMGLPALSSNEAPAIVQHLMQHSASSSLYVGLSISKKMPQNYQEDLYLIGLAFRHSQQSFDNLEVLVHNYEEQFLLDYLHTNLHHDVSQELVNQANVNYLPAFLLLYDYYEKKDAWSKANDIKELSLKIAEAAQKGEQVRAYLEKDFQGENTKPMVEISHKEIETQFMELPYMVNLYAGATEVSNADYELFLTDLIRKKEFEQVQQHQIYKTDWRSYLPKKHQNLQEEVLYQNGNPNDPDAPIQNISYASAVAYCQWLTQVYNNLEDPKGKKRYKKVLFRLPTAKEWEAAVLGQSLYRETTASNSPIYPWGKGYRNTKGCFLGNFNTTEEELCKDCEEQKKDPKDGVFFTTRVKAYFPNDWGLFQTVGNVAEMVQEQGIAKGGSWYHTPKASAVQETQTYSQPEPYIGFRVFMEVVEEGNQDKVKKGHSGPPATFHLKGNLYMDETEISNISWKEYVYWIKENKPEEYKKVQPDTTVWKSLGEENEPFVKHYYQKTAYQDYPVVGISHQQAAAYCQWRTARVQEMLALNPSGQKKFGTIAYRLPSEEEWEYAASAGLDKKEFPFGLLTLNNSKGEKVANLNFATTVVMKEQEQVSTITAPINSYTPNAKGYYNMIGNVAEMVQEEGVAKGGAWIHAPQQSQITQQIPYDGAKAWLGFRCICETGL